ncbi:DegT/DnrJ/EryC1/StrS aminotransferase [Methanothermus fervidus DSM 2088]|uniref:DegT/DnrJ/EryC1/StrS aminotransferase n=1 Tax=Methanothermus fervidus (strain ATCC 43054 / DSM 2088 / JCM 10308 / V24 S) TaxID=523846 RepID=E3GW77_METFV|nr:DegT/DnrJ/EryC1/StrS family aminotransferase [Methanothermus fervidus]ADP77842.1 DegT/DnrJ/EryC1/StrS aminotransferase [Methanothermus fervidus DSM 2088]
MIPISKPMIGDEEINEVINVLKSGQIAQGPMVEKFEKKFAKYVGTKYAVATSSGTTALHLSLLAIGINKGDEVITTPFTFSATSNSILYVGAKPVFVDIDLRTYNIDPNKIEEAITDKTKAIIPVHLYGHPADMDPILEIAEEYSLYVIEDAAQAHGAIYKGSKVGTFGDAACFSFYPTKNITTGEGGMVTTNNKKLAEKIKILRNHGEVERYNQIMLGYNFRMTDVEAAIGIHQLKKLDKFNEIRIKNAKYLTEHLEKLDIITPEEVGNVKHVYHQYTIRVPKRDRWVKCFEKEGINVGIYYPRPVYKQEFYRKMGYKCKCVNAEKASKEVLSLPVHPALTENDLDKIVEVSKDCSKLI